MTAACQLCPFVGQGSNSQAEMGSLIIHAAVAHGDQYGEALGRTDDEVLAEYEAAIKARR